MEREKSTSSSLSNYCYIAPLKEKSEGDQNLSVHGDYVQFHDLNSDKIIDFSYNKVFLDHKDFEKAGYNAALAKTVNLVKEGDSTLAIFGGVQAYAKDQQPVAYKIMHEMLCKAAVQLLDSIHSGDKKNGSVTFSWYKIDCTTTEVISDVLKSASNAQGSAAAGETTSLMLRELGKGRGVTVPGLWEVEISSAADIEAVVNHVQKIFPQTETTLGTSHTIMQLTVTNKSKQHAAASTHKVNPTILSDPPGVGRISFLLLSNLTPSLTSVQTYHWVDHASIVMQWLDQKRPSPPFHKSRVLLLLKDVIMRRQKAVLFMTLEPDQGLHHVNYQWLRLVALLTKDVMTSTQVSSSLASSHYTNVNSSNNNNSDASATIVPHAPKSASKLKNTTISNNKNDNNNNNNNNTTGIRSNNSSNNNLLDLASNRPPQPPDLLSLTNANNIDAQYESFTATNTKYNTSVNALSSINNNNNNITKQQSHHVTNDLHDIMQSQITKEANFISSRVDLRQSVNNNAKLRATATSPSSNTSNNNNNEFNLIPDTGQNETIAALTMALEGSRNEAAAMKIAYNYSNEKYEEVKRAYDSLLEQLKEEGAMLIKRDRERYRNALKDLKDYEVYKEVMEAALVRLQSELELYAKENAELKLNRANEEKQAKKQKSFNEQYSKDLCATKKKLAETTLLLQQSEKTIKTLTKDRDVAVATLAQVKSQSSQKEGQLVKSQELRQQEVDEIKKKLNEAAIRVKQVEQEKELLMSNYNKELSNLRGAHSKALETLMSYQEDNDKLRSDNAKLVEKLNALGVTNNNDKERGGNNNNNNYDNGSLNESKNETETVLS